MDTQQISKLYCMNRNRLFSPGKRETERSQDNGLSCIRQLQRERGLCPVGIGLEILTLNGCEGD